MAPISARKAAQIARNAAGIVAVELIAAAQGVDYHRPLKRRQSQPLHAKIRTISPAPGIRPLLGRRDGRAPGGGAGGEVGTPASL